MTKLAIACASGSFKGVFVHGVLQAFEDAHFFADAYAAASSSTIPASFASIRSLHRITKLAYWKKNVCRIPLKRDGYCKIYFTWYR